MTPGDLRQDFDRLLAERDRPHVERLTLAAAIVSESFRLQGLDGALVGGGAVEFYVPGGYATTDIDLVVEWRSRPGDLDAALAAALEPLGFSRRGRHWVRDEWFVEIPSTSLTDPVERFAIGPYTLRVLRKEIVLGERVVGFKHWRVTGFGAQAIDMIAALAEDLDEDLLRRYLRRGAAEDAYEVLRSLASAEQPITEEVLRKALDSVIHGERAEDEA